MTEIRIELHSDTQTRPTPGMRKAMAEAVVGDEQKGEDPSVRAAMAIALGLLKDRASAEALEKAALDLGEDPDLRGYATLSLAMISKPERSSRARTSIGWQSTIWGKCRCRKR